MSWFKRGHLKRTIGAFHSLLLCAFPLGCGDGLESSDSSAGIAGAPGDEPLKRAPSFEDLYSAVLVPGLCTASTCHGEQVQGGRMDMRTAEIAFESLNAGKAQGPQCVATEAVRVVPGKPDESLLYLKLFHEQLPCGRLMPPTATIISAEDKQLVSDWIKSGANWDAADL